MNGRILVRILAVLVLIAVLVGIGSSVYNAGVAQGLADSGRLVAPGGAPYPYYGGPFAYRPFGFGFGFLGCLFPLFFLLLFFGLFRGFGRRGWDGHGGPRGAWGGKLPSMFEEWHRQAHNPAPTQEAGGGAVEKG